MSQYKPLPPVSRLRKLFALRSDGKLIWKRPPSIRAKAGSEAGCLSRGYITVGLDGLKYFAHRIVWALANGTDPCQVPIDHIDGNPQNNHPSNLRLCNQKQNGLNTKTHSTNSSGIKGVSYDPSSLSRPWRSYVKGKKLGRFATREEAAMALRIEIGNSEDRRFYRNDFLW